MYTQFWWGKAQEKLASWKNQKLILTCSYGNGLWEKKANQTGSGTCLLTRALKLHHVVFDQLKGKDKGKGKFWLSTTIIKP